MLKQIEGSRAVAEAVAMCRPQVICAYTITPQTHIVEALSAMVKKEELAAEFLNVESEFAAMSVAIGASAAGTRAYTATASQGLLYMSEAVWNAAGDELARRRDEDRRARHHGPRLLYPERNEDT
jgi:pyruvate ferredoxin oxidoreductase alpha subunit